LLHHDDQAPVITRKLVIGRNDVRMIQALQEDVLLVEPVQKVPNGIGRGLDELDGDGNPAVCDPSPDGSKAALAKRIDSVIRRFPSDIVESKNVPRSSTHPGHSSTAKWPIWDSPDRPGLPLYSTDVQTASQAGSGSRLGHGQRVRPPLPCWP